MVAQHAEVAQIFTQGGLQGHGGGRRGGLEANGQEDDFAVGVGAGQREGIVHGVNNAHIGPLRSGAEQAELTGAGHAQGVAVAGQDHAWTLGELNGHVDAADGQDAHRAGGAVDHLDLRRQQIQHAVAGQGVRVATAELHEAVAAISLDRRSQFVRQVASQGGVAEFADVFHLCGPCAIQSWCLAGSAVAGCACCAASSANKASVRAASSGSSRLMA